MDIVLSVLGWTAALMLVGLLVLLVTPLVFRFNGEARAGLRASVTMAPLGGLVPGVVVFDSDRPDKPKKKKPEKTKRTKKKKRRSGLRMMRNIPRLARDLLRRIRIDRLSVSGRFGLGDPADTGALYGMLMPLIHSGPGRKLDLDLRPDFEAAVLEGRVEAQASFTPVALVPPLLRFGWRVFGPVR